RRPGQRGGDGPDPRRVCDRGGDGRSCDLAEPAEPLAPQRPGARRARILEPLMPTRLGYRPSLDGIRGLAIASVVGFHAFGHPAGGYLGVDLFFVLSGFLITTLLLEERDEGGRVSLRAFYARRALRLLPGLVVMLATVVAVVVVRAVANGDQHNLGRTLIFAAAGIGYATNIVLAASGNAAPSLAHLWSLAT